MTLVLKHTQTTIFGALRETKIWTWHLVRSNRKEAENFLKYQGATETKLRVPDSQQPIFIINGQVLNFINGFFHTTPTKKG